LSCTLVRDGNVWQSTRSRTSAFSRPGPRVIDVAEILGRILHPDVVGPTEELYVPRMPPKLTRV
jgi:hypothetical protein